MSQLKIFLFGKFQMQYGEQTLIGIEARKAQELFCYILLHRDRPHPREILADMLWGDKPTVQPKKCLRQALWQLQHRFETQIELLMSQLLLIEPDWIQINPQMKDIWIDVTIFEQAFESAYGVLGHQLTASNAQRLQNAVDLYRGDLLEGWYQDWCLRERERLQNIYLTMLEKLMDYCEAHYDYERGQAYGECILRCDPAREGIHRHLMRLHYLAGHRTAALRQYERCAAVLDKELGVKPGRRTIGLYNQIRADKLDDALPTPIEIIPAPKLPPTSLHEVLFHLEQIRTNLTTIQRLVDQEVQAVSHALKDLHRTDLN